MKLRSLFVVLTLAFVASAPVLAAGGSKEPSSPPESSGDVEEQATEHYNAGIDNRDEAWKLQKSTDDPTISDEKRGQIDRRIRSAYERAIEEFSAATMLRPDYHQAFASLGYAQRQLGNYRSALQAYQKALSLDPDYVEAIEYLGEAYLGLNRIDEAKASWERLTELDGKLADELLGAMRSWTAERRDDPAGVKVGQLDELERWVAERAEGQRLPTTSSLGKSRSW